MRYLNRRSGATLAALLAATAAQAQTPAVMTEIPVTHSLVAQVMGTLGTPDLLLEPGADPHHFQLRPSQARAVAQADLVVWMGPDLTPWMARTTDTLSSARVLGLLEVSQTRLRPYSDAALLASGVEGHSHGAHDDGAHDHGDHDDHDHDDHGHDGHEHDDHGHDDHDSHHHDDHEHSHDAHAHAHDDDDHDHTQAHHDHDHQHGDIDPHAWLDPTNAQVWLAAIADELASLDPENADTYRANAQAGHARIDALHTELEAILAPARDTGIVVYHDAYGYLAARYGLNILGSVTLGDAAAPGAARISAIRANLEQAGAECIFPEANHPDAYVALVSEDSALRVGAPLDPAGTMLEAGPALYETLMRTMAEAIADCAAGN